MTPRFERGAAHGNSAWYLVAKSRSTLARACAALEHLSEHCTLVPQGRDPAHRAIALHLRPHSREARGLLHARPIVDLQDLPLLDLSRRVLQLPRGLTVAGEAEGICEDSILDHFKEGASLLEEYGALVPCRCRPTLQVVAHGLAANAQDIR